MYGNDDAKSAIGKKVSSINTDSSEDMVLHFEDGSKLSLQLDGDCCSSSYFTEDATTDAKDLVGTTITSFDESYGSGGDHGPYSDEGGYDSCTSWHFLTIYTNQGHVTLDWRNDSNGYYDGTLSFKFTKAAELKS
jgi:hypothetical protein